MASICLGLNVLSDHYDWGECCWAKCGSDRPLGHTYHAHKACVNMNTTRLNIYVSYILLCSIKHATQRTHPWYQFLKIHIQSIFSMRTVYKSRINQLMWLSSQEHQLERSWRYLSGHVIIRHWLELIATLSIRVCHKQWLVCKMVDEYVLRVLNGTFFGKSFESFFISIWRLIAWYFSSIDLCLRGRVVIDSWRVAHFLCVGFYRTFSFME